jgi:hypothetical protein
MLLLTGACSDQNTYNIKPLAQDYKIVYQVPNPKNMACGTPAIVRLKNERLVVSVDTWGEGVQKVDGVKSIYPITGTAIQGKIFTSDDRGITWKFRQNFPFVHSRLFEAGESLYLLGQLGDLFIMVSKDDGETWSEPIKLTEGETWHASSMNVLYAKDNIYLVMEKRFERGLIKCWRVGDMAPILMRAPVHSDLTDINNWTFASPLVFEDVVQPKDLENFGIPFFTSKQDSATYPAPDRGMSPIGWLETNVVQFTDPMHIWHDSTGNTFHLWMRAHTGGTGYAAIAKVVEQPDGSMETQIETVPSGKKILFVPLPGGQMKFFVVYENVTKLYWLISTQATDSMIPINKMPENRYNLPNNERRRLQLHFSKNMIDWCFAGIIAIGPIEQASRHYVSAAIDESDLLVVSRSGDEKAQNPHNVNLITFHRIQNFRELVY